MKITGLLLCIILLLASADSVSGKHSKQKHQGTEVEDGGDDSADEDSVDKEDEDEQKDDDDDDKDEE